MPFLYKPTIVKFLKQNDIQNAVRDSRIPFGEAIHKKKFVDTERTMRAQNVFKKKDFLDRTYTGDANDAIGHLCISKKDFDALEFKPEKSDVITSITGITVRYKIVEIRPAGHIDIWSSLGFKTAEHSLYLIFYEQDKETTPKVGII